MSASGRNSLVAIAVAVAACDARPARRDEQPAPAPTPEAAATSAEPAVPARATPAAAAGTMQAAPWMEGARRVAGMRVGDRALIVAAGTGWLRVFEPGGELVAEHTAVGAAHDLEIVDVDGDGTPEVVDARGFNRDAMKAPASVTVIFGAHTDAPRREAIALPDTSRAQVADVATAGTDLIVAAYDSKYMVTVVRATRGGDGKWTTQTADRVRVLTGVAAVGDELAYARAYGATIEADGFVTVGDTRVPSTRGARAIAAAPGGVVFADGWHRAYGEQARALITVAQRTPAGWRARTLANVDQRFGFDRLRVGDIDGDGTPDAIAAGNGPAITVPLSGDRPAQTIDHIDAVDAFPFDIDGDGRDEVLVAGQSPGIWAPSVR